MALPTIGPLSLSQIQLEIGGSLSNVSLREMSDFAGFSTPDAMSDFYGWSSIQISDIGIVRSHVQPDIVVQIQQTTNPQAFESDYIIQQQFLFNIYNFEYRMVYDSVVDYDFYFNNTFQGSNSMHYVYSIIPGAVVYNATPQGSPTLNDNGLPVNLVNWS